MYNNILTISLDNDNIDNTFKEYTNKNKSDSTI